MSEEPRTQSASGIGFAVTAYVLWGITPIYWKALLDVPAVETLLPRILWTAIFMLIVSILAGRAHEIGRVTGREAAASLGAAILLAINWGTFIYAIQSGQVLATSLGYYINPLMSILIGLVVLGERLNRVQAFAIALAAIGVATMTLRLGEFPWISFVLALSFAFYGLSHKLAPQPALAGLSREMLLLSPLALAGWFTFDAVSDTVLGTLDWKRHAFLSLTSIVTAGPLLAFHAATRRLPLVAVGMFQYIAPTITLLLATIVYKEAFTSGHALGFGCVWVGLAIFSFDSIRRSRTKG